MSERISQVDRIMTVMEKAFDPAFGEAWNRRQISDALAMPSTHAIVVDESGIELSRSTENQQPAAFVLTRAAADEEELLLIAVAPEHRRRGLAKALISHLFAQARERGSTKIFLQMRCGNPAERLYRSVGFTPIGRRSNYYRLANGSRADAITFGRPIA